MPGGRWAKGEIRFDSPEDLDQELDAFIAKGAVRMSGDALPGPLEPFQFRLVTPSGSSVPLRGMIVSQSGGLSLVQILDFSQAVAVKIRAASTVPPGQPLPEVVPAPPPASPTPPLVLQPARTTITRPPPPGERRRSTTGSPETPWDGPARPATTPPAGPPPGRTHATIQPPLGAPRTSSSPPFVRPGPLPTSPPPVAGATPGDAFDDPLTWQTPRASTGVFPLTAGVPMGAFAGSLSNPQGLDGLMSLPLGPIAAVRDVERVSTVGLLRFLGARRASGTLVLRGAAGGERILQLDRGAYLLSPAERDTLRPIFQWPAGTFDYEPGFPAPSPQRLPISAWRIVLDAVKLMVREAPQQELAARLDATRGVKLTAAYAERARTLDLAPNEERLVRRDLDGRLSLREIYRLGGVSELGVQRLVIMLLALGLCELTTAEGVVVPQVDAVREHYLRLVGGDLFNALGVHWSDAPERIPPAYQTMREKYGPGSAAAASSPDHAAKITELVERAYRRLRDRPGRRHYRAELAVDVRHAAELLAAQVPIARARGEIRKASELINAACDLFDNPAWEKLRADLTGR